MPMQQAAKAELPNNETPEGQAQYTAEDIKNLQAFWTKAQQEKIEFAKKLVQKDPIELKTLDKELQNKVIKQVYGYDNIEELEIMLPSLFEQEKEKKGEDE